MRSLTKLPEPILSAKQSETIEKQAQRELASRELARRDLLHFIKRTMPQYNANWVHRELADALIQFYADVQARKSPRLVIALPPRFGKSELSSIRFPAWALGKDPSLEVVLASYAANLSDEFSKKTRELLRDDDYSLVFPDTKLHKDMASVDAWKTTKMGGYVSVGVGGGLTGKGSHILIIDDSLKDRAEAESESTKNGVWDWYRSVAYTRLHPGGGVIVIGTRWATDDLTGRILENAEESGENWRILSYPAIAEEDDARRKVGEALHPERYDIDALNRIRRTLGERDWASLYQQRPVPESGNLFKREMFKPYKEHPPLHELGVFACWDLSTGRGTDYSVGVVAGIDVNNDLYILDLVRGKFQSLDLCEKIFETHEKWNLQRTGIEIGQIEASIAPILSKMMNERKKFITIDKLKPGRANKVARSMSIIARMEQGKVLFPVDAQWFSYYQTELMNFPAYKNDDAVDATAYLAYMLEFVNAPMKKQPPKRPSWKDKLKKLGKSTDGSWMSA